MPDPNGGDEPDAPAGAGRPFFSLSLRWGTVLNSLTLLACLPVVASLGARWHWLLELPTHFSGQFAVATLPLLIVCLARRRRWLTLLTGAALVVCLVRVAPLLLPADGPPPQGPALRVFSQNVLTANRQFGRLLELIERENPDVVILSEVDQGWIDAMAPLEERYPTVVKRVRPDNFGVALYTRLDSEEARVEQFDPGGVPSVVARVVWQGKPLTIVGAHPLPPISADYAAERNRQLAAIAAFVAESGQPAVVVGDLNVTPFSPRFRELLSSGGLADSGAGRGFQPTWSSRIHWLGLPIDHALATAELAVADRRVGPPVGSDHRAVVVDFAWAEGR